MNIFFEEGHSGLNDFRAQIIDVTDVLISQRKGKVFGLKN